jgi:hypothetical protein
MDNKRFLVLMAILLGLLVTLLVLVQVTGASAETAKAAFVTLENRDGVLNVRTSPVTGEIICQLYDGQDVYVVDVLDGWALVCDPQNCGDPLGWVCMDYIHVYSAEMNIDGGLTK